MSQRETEKSDDAIAQHPEDVALVPIYAGRAGLFVGAKDDLLPFGIELVGKLGGLHHVAEQYRQLAALTGSRPGLRGRFVERPSLAQHVEDSLARSERDTKLLEITVGQHPKGRKVNLVFLEDFNETFEVV